MSAALELVIATAAPVALLMYVFGLGWLMTYDLNEDRTMIQALFAWLGDLLLKIARPTPYFHIYDGGSRYMARFWLLGARSPERNTNNPAWRVGPIPESSAFYRWLTRRFAARVHLIERSDKARDFHNHPFSFVSIVLKGGYWELVSDTSITERIITFIEKTDNPDRRTRRLMKAVGAIWRGPGSIAYRPADTYHRIIIPNGRPALTVCLLGPKRGSWGFMTAGGYVPWRDYIDGKAEAPLPTIDYPGIIGERVARLGMALEEAERRLAVTADEMRAAPPWRWQADPTLAVENADYVPQPVPAEAVADIPMLRDVHTSAPAADCGSSSYDSSSSSSSDSGGCSGGE